jgi:Na+/H+ antiporter NhaD/arsenite permease-like protein
MPPHRRATASISPPFLPGGEILLGGPPLSSPISPKLILLGGLGLLATPAAAFAGGEEGLLDLPPWTVLPFVLVLLGVAILPLVARRFWERNRNKALVMTLLALPVAVYLLVTGPATNHLSTHALIHQLGQYTSFIILLGSLYTISGGIVLQGNLEGRPLTNLAFLALGGGLANVIGTTGASMLFIRPFLRINRERRHTAHLPVFFIFIVSNLGGLLTPLGDPPLFLGYLGGVDFFWTLSLWPQWLVANGIVLTVFFLWDLLAYRHETPQALAADAAHVTPLRVRGLLNLLFLAGILVAVLFQSERIGRGSAGLVAPFFPCPELTLVWPWGEALMLLMALGSWLTTPFALRTANAFSWSAIIEVAILFAGIFVTMVPALALLSVHGRSLGITQPWQFFWLSGGLSSFLDNAPTYLAFATLAAGPHALGSLMDNPAVLQAVSCGSVFMGANTYIGNGPNFMVKALADEAGVRTPSFFGYMFYSGLILLPTFGLLTLLFFLEGPPP